MADTKREPTTRRRWLAVLLATVMMLGSFVLFIYGLAAISGDETQFGGGLIGIGLGLVPGVFAAAAWVSQNQHALRATAAAILIWLAVTLALAPFSLPIALVAGYGAGGVFAFRLRPGNSRRSRVLAVVACVVYTGALLTISTPVGLFGGAPLPFAAIALADVYKESATR